MAAEHGAGPRALEEQLPHLLGAQAPGKPEAAAEPAPAAQVPEEAQRAASLGLCLQPLHFMENPPPGSWAPHFVDWYREGREKGLRQLWDKGEPQPGLVELRRRRPECFASPVLDVGCGLGDNGIWLAAEGEQVVSVDVSPDAVAEAQERLRQHGTTKGSVDFLCCDILQVPLPDNVRDRAPFGTIVDSACFHCVGDTTAQRQYVESVTPLVRSGGHLVMLACSDKNPESLRGPPRISETQLRASFGEDSGWRVLELEEGLFRDLLGRDLKNWLLVAQRI